MQLEDLLPFMDTVTISRGEDLVGAQPFTLTSNEAGQCSNRDYLNAIIVCGRLFDY